MTKMNEYHYSDNSIAASAPDESKGSNCIGLVHFWKHEPIAAFLQFDLLGPKAQSEGHVEGIVKDDLETSLIAAHLENGHRKSRRLTEVLVLIVLN